MYSNLDACKSSRDSRMEYFFYIHFYYWDRHQWRIRDDINSIWPQSKKWWIRDMCLFLTLQVMFSCKKANANLSKKKVLGSFYSHSRYFSLSYCVEYWLSHKSFWLNQRVPVWRLIKWTKNWSRLRFSCSWLLCFLKTKSFWVSESLLKWNRAEARLREKLRIWEL